MNTYVHAHMDTIFMTCVEYEEAIELYSEALRVYPEDCGSERSVCHANRAACYVKMVSCVFFIWCTLVFHYVATVNLKLVVYVHT